MGPGTVAVRGLARAKAATKAGRRRRQGPFLATCGSRVTTRTTDVGMQAAATTPRTARTATATATPKFPRTTCHPISVALPTPEFRRTLANPSPLQPNPAFPASPAPATAKAAGVPRPKPATATSAPAGMVGVGRQPPPKTDPRPLGYHPLAIGLVMRRGNRAFPLRIGRILGTRSNQK